MLSQLLRNNYKSIKDGKAASANYSFLIKESDIIENPDEAVVDFSEIHNKEKVYLPFFRSIMAQLKLIYG